MRSEPKQTATMSIQFPKTAGDAAVLLVEQMWTAINQGHVIAADPQFEDGFYAWLRTATRVLAESERTTT
jgi:hypothetical protein